MLERLSVVAAPGSYEITPGQHTATFYSTASSRSLGTRSAKTVQPSLDALWCKYSNELYDIVTKQYYGHSVPAMTNVIHPIQLLAIALAGWLTGALPCYTACRSTLISGLPLPAIV